MTDPRSQTAANPSADAVIPRWATGVAAGLWAAGCRDIVYVPDNPLSHILAALLRHHTEVRTLLAMREEEALGIAAGLYLGGARPAVLMQSSGVGNTLNAIGSLLIPYQVPVMLVVSMRGDPGEWNSAQVPMGRAVAPVLDAFGVQHLTVERDEEAEGKVLALGHNVDGSRRQLVQGFRGGTRSVLLGAGIFWESADDLGDEYACLVITKLPFPPASARRSS